MKKLTTRQLLIAVLVFDFVLFGALYISNTERQNEPLDRQISESSIQRICELATLDCFYHNVSKWSKPGNFLGYGAKRLWIEYDGIVRVGVKADQIKISEPDQDGLVAVTIPDAIILDKDLDEESMLEIDSSSPMWGFVPLYSDVSTEERKIALADAQEDMVASASENGMVLDEAQDRAKKIIEKNIVAMGKASGKKYKVKFTDAATTPATNEDQTASPADET